MPDQKRSILCVDDEYSILTIRKIVLESNGYEVHIAESGQKALEVFAANPIHAVLLDYTMPQMSGGEVAEQLRKLRPEVPVIMVSAATEIPEDAIKFIDAFIQKG